MARQAGPFTILGRPPRTKDPRAWDRWFQNIYSALSGLPGIAWDVVDKTGSDLTDIETRNHNDLQFNRKTKTVDYTIIYTDDTIFGDATAGMIIQTLPTAVGADESHEIKKIDSSSNFVRVAALSGELVAGAAYFDLELEGESISVSSTGIGWFA